MILIGGLRWEREACHIDNFRTVLFGGRPLVGYFRGCPLGGSNGLAVADTLIVLGKSYAFS